MFNRLARCLLVKTTLNVKPARTITSRNPQCLNRDLSVSQKNWFCTGVEKPGDLESQENEKKVEKTELTSLLESDPMLEKRYKILQLEIDVLRHAGKLVPDDIKPQHWLQLLKQETRTARRKYLNFLFTVEKKRENTKKKKELVKIERAKLQESGAEVPDESEYRLHKTSMFMRIYDTTIHNFYHSRLIHAMMFGPKLIIDCGYYDRMTSRESTECAKQLTYMFGMNRLHREPFDLHFCNVNKSSLLMQKFKRMLPTAYDPDFPLNIVEESYTKKFDKNKLVYLTPHCNNEMTEFDPHAIYIIGAIVDKTNSEPLSLARAKKEGLKMAKLPLDKYLLWSSGSGKRLPLNQMVNILTDLRITGDWHKALKHIPRRKLERSVDDLQLDNSVPKQRNERYERNSNDKPFTSNENKIRNSFTFKDRQKRSFNK